MSVRMNYKRLTQEDINYIKSKDLASEFSTYITSLFYYNAYQRAIFISVKRE